jgi:Thiamine pyrophosphate enzyme, N-terminal TPP binding domain/Alpha-acetolactate decarboxylase
MRRTKEGVPLVQAAAIQPEVEFQYVSGTLVGFWTPEYAKTLNVPGYHLHFISTDRTRGGHLLQCRGKHLRLQIQRDGDYHIALPETEDFLKANLEHDPTAALCASGRKKEMSATVTKPVPQTGAGLLVKSLEAQGVEYIFGVPGAKLDKVFDTLLDSKIQTVVCRHEQNAAFMASGVGRMTGKAGVALVTSGPGCSNLVTGFATASSEGDPVVGIGGVVPVADRLKQLHQSMDTVNLFRSTTKVQPEIDSPSAVSEVVANAFRAAESGRPGAAFISAPKDIMMGEATGEVLTPAEPQKPERQTRTPSPRPPP